MNIKQESGIKKMLYNLGFGFSNMENNRYHFTNDDLKAVLDTSNSNLIIYHNEDVIYEQNKIDNNFDAKNIYNGIKDFI